MKKNMSENLDQFSEKIETIGSAIAAIIGIIGGLITLVGIWAVSETAMYLLLGLLTLAAAYIIYQSFVFKAKVVRAFGHLCDNVEDTKILVSDILKSSTREQNWNEQLPPM